MTLKFKVDYTPGDDNTPGDENEKLSHLLDITFGSSYELRKKYNQAKLDLNNEKSLREISLNEITNLRDRIEVLQDQNKLLNEQVDTLAARVAKAERKRK